MKINHSKRLKAIGFSSLALLMGILGTLAFAPLQGTQISSASEAEISTESAGLITLKADDPVIYTTESGLEIKFGNATVANGGGNETMEYDNMTSGNLNGFPYFTTQKNSTTYTWVIIGKSTTMPSNVVSQVYDTLTNWRNKTAESPTYKNFFDNSYEETTPAGAAIKNNNILNDQTARKLTKPLTSISSIKATEEIPSGCLLCLLNTPYESTTWSSSYYSTVQYISNTSNYVNRKLTSYETNDTFGFGTLLSDVQSTTVTQHNRYRLNASASTGANTSVTFKFFPLGTGDTQIYESTNFAPIYPGSQVENFIMRNYLTAAQYATSQITWSRGNGFCDSGGAIFLKDGSIHGGWKQGTNNIDSTAYLRPACVLKIT